MRVRCARQAALAAQYASAAGACGLQHSEAALQGALHACLDTLEAGRRELVPPDSAQWRQDGLVADAPFGAVGATAGAIAAKTAALPLHDRSEQGRAQFDAQLAALAASADAQEEAHAQMPFIPGM